jgi:hypothetical protein
LLRERLEQIGKQGYDVDAHGYFRGAKRRSRVANRR